MSANSSVTTVTSIADNVKYMFPENANAVFQFFPKVKYDKIDIDKLSLPSPTTKSIPGDNKMTFKSSTAEYNMEVNGVEKNVEFRFEGPPLLSKYGIKEMVDPKNGNKSYSIYTTLYQKEDDINYFTNNTLKSLHNKMCELTAKYGASFGCPNVTFGGLRERIPQLFKYRKDKATEQLFLDKDPVLYNRLIIGKERTIFVGLDKKIIPWHVLQNVEMKFIPVYRLDLYVGGGGTVITFPLRVIEATVLFYDKVTLYSSQLDTIERYRDEFLERYKRSVIAAQSEENSDETEENNETSSTLGAVQVTKPPENMAKPSLTPPVRTPEYFSNSSTVTSSPSFQENAVELPTRKTVRRGKLI